MPVRTAESIMAQARAVKRQLAENPNEPISLATFPRRRVVNPNIPAGSVPARTPYYIEADPKPLGRKVKPMPRRLVPDVPTEPEPEGVPQEFTLVSTTPSDKEKQNILWFKPANKDARVDITAFQGPIKLNRKHHQSQLYAEPEPQDVKPGKLTPMLGPDGQPVYHNGEIVMVNAEGQTTISAAKAKVPKDAKGKGKAADAAAPAKKKAPNKPKIRQVFKAPEDVRKKAMEERVPWLMEDAGQQEWVGKMDDTNDRNVYAILRINEAKGVFEFVPVHRFYSFLPKSQVSRGIRAEDAHQAFTTGKKIDLAAGFAQRNGGKVSKATLRTLAKAEKMEAEEMKPRIKREAPGSDDEGGRDEMDDLFDEVDYDEQVADDDDGDGRDDMAEDEEDKEAKERIKREWATAKVGERAGFEEEDEEMDTHVHLNSDGKRYKKALKRSGDFDSDESDDDDEDDYYGQKYGTKKEDDEDTDLPMAIGVQDQSRPAAKAATPTPAPTATPAKAASSGPMDVDSAVNKPVAAVKPANKVGAAARAASPKVPAGTGSALLAKRAASPPRRPGSGNPHSRAGSPVARAASPLAQEAARAPSPAGPPKKKVKVAAPATNAPAAAGPSTTPAAPKKAKVIMPTAKDVIDFIKGAGGQVPVNDLAARFRTKDSPEVKKQLIALVKEVGKMANKQEGQPWVTLKPEYM